MPLNARDFFSFCLLELDIVFRVRKFPPVTNPPEDPNLSFTPRCFIPKALMSFLITVMKTYSMNDEGLADIKRDRPRAVMMHAMKAAPARTVVFPRLERLLYENTRGALFFLVFFFDE